MFGIFQLKGRGGWNPCFSRPFNDWEIDCVERFLVCLQGQRTCRDVEDTLLWSVSKSDKFIVKTLYNVLEPNIGGYFPINDIWLSWVQPRVGLFFFFAWEVVYMG